MRNPTDAAISCPSRKRLRSHHMSAPPSMNSVERTPPPARHIFIYSKKSLLSQSNAFVAMRVSQPESKCKLLQIYSFCLLMLENRSACQSASTRSRKDGTWREGPYIPTRWVRRSPVRKRQDEIQRQNEYAVISTWPAPPGVKIQILHRQVCQFSGPTVAALTWPSRSW
ncbi:hypothetical protein MPTK1_5g02320 [Marchantia polymorpha subsp. ruderalis]|uniref:Uncharacterized protein n=2 Tax=Marchantia polymorpha TaxID=3197 RepID=A0AAF6BE51_MARPO|nr:hypothetical protein MARPO_0147s0025 [Marchantia polymorpha]BBN10285.1 hypothetical protein Mp_5g02320 [Marchantia polymorpha subsp. ruderalis]|eukprot:PTQ29146.1 hypothetical protein MARPO_0147s0025 [Marchantia polymorpha]